VSPAQLFNPSITACVWLLLISKLAKTSSRPKEIQLY
jgi:hypothetical protein